MNVYTLFLCISLALTAIAGCSEIQAQIPPPDSVKEPDKPEVEQPVEKRLRYSDFLDEMLSFDGLTRYPALEYESRQESSRDRRSTDPSDPLWFANDDGWGYERFEFPDGRTEKVIFDERHPGVITRMWLTSFGSPETVVRFYFDGADEPSWVMNTYNLKEFGAFAGVSLGDGLAQPSSAWIRGSSLYLPVSWSKSCKITIEELVEPTTVSRYYHINYRRYADDVQIQTLTPGILKQNSSKLKLLSSALLNPVPDSGTMQATKMELSPSAEDCLELPSGTKSLNELVVAVSVPDGSDLQSAVQGLVVEGWFDSERMLSVPVAYLAGAGKGGFYNRSWRFESNGKGRFTIRWKMPYRSSARLVFRNCSSAGLSLDISTLTSDYVWDEYSLYFHAAYKTVDRFPIRYWSDYANGVEWNFARIVGGRGVYAGDVYCIDNGTSQWPGEGDEKIWVDNEEFPSHFGTGVEDYYSFCGYFRFHTPFSGEPRLDANNFHGINIHYRTRNLDIIPFKGKLVFNLEMEGHEAGYANLENAVFWYGDSSTKAADAVTFN